VEWVESCDRADTSSHQHGQDRLRATEPTVPGEPASAPSRIGRQQNANTCSRACAILMCVSIL